MLVFIVLLAKGDCIAQDWRIDYFAVSVGSIRKMEQKHHIGLSEMLQKLDALYSKEEMLKKDLLQTIQDIEMLEMSIMYLSNKEAIKNGK